MEQIIKNHQCVGEIISKHMKLNGTSRRKTAAKAGVAVNTVRNIEDCQEGSSIGAILKLLKFLDLEMVIREKQIERGG